MTSAFVSEIYSSIQGEGPYTGERQIFVRLAGCPLRCCYCDTPDSLVASGHPRQTVEDVLTEVSRLRRQSRATTVSFTGGEPLAQPLFLLELFRQLKKRRFRTYLETAGIHAKALSTLIKFVDVVSMDMKLPSATGRDLWREHQEFLRIGGKKIFVKIVLEKKSKLEEVRKAIRMLSQQKQPPLLVLQPATPIDNQVAAPLADFVADAYSLATTSLARVFIMQQQHKFWGVR